LHSKYPFWFYAYDNLTFHLNECEESLTRDSVLEFINKEGCVTLYLINTRRDYITGYVDSNPLSMACLLNHSLAVRSLIERGGVVLCGDGDRGTLLHTTLRDERRRSLGFTRHSWLERKAEIVSLLFNAGVDISAADDLGTTTIQLAAGVAGGLVLL
jgi:ankyrin repeat protein